MGVVRGEWEGESRGESRGESEKGREESGEESGEEGEVVQRCKVRYQTGRGVAGQIAEYGVQITEER
jgi:hypothetical protein